MAKPLLPTGCYDLLPPFARQESELSAALLSVFESYGYEQVSPPLLEFSDSLLAGRGAALSAQTFRVMDPTAHKVMGLRADITLQIARIVTSRLTDGPLPLRVCYNGLILRLQAEQLRGDRQLRQAGIELVGSASPEADAEVIIVAASALKKTGIGAISIDLNLPGILSTLLADEPLDNEQLQRLFEAVAHKDVSSVRSIPFRYQESLIGLMQCAGPAVQALEAIAKLDLPASAKPQLRGLQAVIDILTRYASADWTLTVDATEHRGLSYHSGISFSIFVPGAACEVGRGGRYRIEGNAAHPSIEATGFTLYVDTLRQLLPQPMRGKRILVCDQLDSATIGQFQTEGYVTVHALPEYGQGEDEARRLGCGWIYENGKLRMLGEL